MSMGAGAAGIGVPGTVEAVRERLLTALLVGEYLPGQRLPGERELSELLGVARGTTRTALRALVDEGHLAVERGRNGGYFVTGDRAREDGASARILRARLNEMIEAVRGMAQIEGALSAEAADRRTDADVRILRSRLDSYLDAESGAAKQCADAELHAAIHDTARTPALTDALLYLEKRISLAAPMHVWGMTEDHGAMEARAAGEHSRLVELISAGRADDARELARSHTLIDLELIESARAHAEARARTLLR